MTCGKLMYSHSNATPTTSVVEPRPLSEAFKFTAHPVLKLDVLDGHLKEAA